MITLSIFLASCSKVIQEEIAQCKNTKHDFEVWDKVSYKLQFDNAIPWRITKISCKTWTARYSFISDDETKWLNSFWSVNFVRR